MYSRLAVSAALSLVLTSGCDIYPDLLDKALDAEGRGPKVPPPPPPADEPDPVRGGTCGCERTAEAAYESCLSQVKTEAERGDCGTRYQDIFASCAVSCEEGPCAGQSGTGLYQWGASDVGRGHTPDISCVEALANCSLNSWVNKSRLHCTWNGQPLVGHAPRPVGEPGLEVACGEGGYEPTVRTFGPGGPGRMDVLRIYESRGDHGGGYHPMGDVKVSLDSDDTEVLVLSSYEPTRWHVGRPGRKGLRHIIVTGYHDQEVLAPPGVQIDRHIGPDAWLEIGSADEDPEQTLIQRAAEIAGRRPTTFGYCYQAHGFVVR